MNENVSLHGREANGDDRSTGSVPEPPSITERIGNLAQFFATSPLCGSGLYIERRTDGPRTIEL